MNRKSKIQIAALFAAALFTVVSGIYYFMRYNAPQPVYIIDAAKPAPTAAPETVPRTVTVHITGEVNVPGVYELAVGARVEDAIAAAGGLTDDADDRSINRAAVVTDGQQIIVNNSPEPISPSAAGGALININTAEISELTRLHGVGEAIARAIVDHRERHGPFLAIEQLMNVSGIGERSFERMRDFITVE
jgi:competence protein ComEA